MLKGRASGGKPEIVVVKDDIIVFQWLIVETNFKYSIVGIFVLKQLSCL